MNYWLLKSEPGTYSIDDLKKDKRTSWEGVRNYQARNFMRDQMRKGDLVLFYHSNAEPSGVAGICRVVKEGYPDTTTKETGWVMVDVEFIEKFKRFVSLEELKGNKKLVGMLVTRRGMRLSVQPVDKAHFERLDVIKKVIITRRVWQIVAALGIVLLGMLGRYYPLGPWHGFRIGGWIFTATVGLAFLREERRATRSPHSNLVINWNLVEAASFLLLLLGYYGAAFVLRLPEADFYAYLNTGALGLLSGLGMGEFIWQNVRLKELNQVCRDRYWACYKDSII